ncbi:radical SAM domain-containing protein, partial [mine drainage metagenome]
MLHAQATSSEIEDRIRNHETLTVDDIVFLYDIADINWLGGLARELTENISGNHVSFVSNLILNYTNICNVRCKFCAFYRTGSESDSYTMTEDQVVQEISKYYDAFDIRQLLIQGGVNPSLPPEYYYSLFSRIRKEFPRIGIHGLSTSEISFIAKKAKLSVKDLLIELRKNGLETIPGAGAEIFDPEVRKKLGRPVNSGRDWLSIMEDALSLGIRTSSTMMFGHVESSRDKANHLLSILELQKKYHGFLSFTPWNFEPGNTQLEKEGLVLLRTGGL